MVTIIRVLAARPGELVASDAHEIVIRRGDREIGEVYVHFPRAGFVVALSQQ